MIETFRRWLLERRSTLEREGIALEIAKGSEGLLKNGISAVLTSDRFESRIELWETGESEFYFADWAVADRDPDYHPEVVHHEFQSYAEMYVALDQLVNRMSPVLV